MLGLGNSMLTGGAPSEFTPADLPDLQLWLKHTSGSTPSGVFNTDDPATEQFPSDAGNSQISKWVDASGNSRHAVDSGASYPTWDTTENALDFSGSADVLSLSPNEIDITGAFSFFFRIKFDSATIDNSDVVTSDTGGTHFLRFQNNKAVRLKIASSPLDFSWPSAVLGTSIFHTVGVTRDDTDDLKVYIDGVGAAENGTVTATQVYRINTIEGGSDAFLKTMIVTSQALSSSERTTLTTYLSKI